MGFEKYYKKNLEETKKKLKQAVKFDDFVVQAINNIDEVNRNINTLAKRLREWYELSNPEFSRAVYDHEKFVLAVINGKDKKIKDSMGAELSKEDLKPIMELAKEIESLFKLKEKQEEYLEKVMQKNCPNITAVAGALIGARLIAIAGDLKRLVGFPSSTVQLLGAEKALFRHMKTGARAPKHGIIHEHPIVAQVGAKDKGKAARVLADKISMAARIDYFKGEFIGDKLRKKLEERFK
ncbi:NOP58 family protein [Candidatus Woesearchaeota archaeon]|nr:NOP58 family protein [Candidatus Woesearchaeota archaeon]